MAKKEYAQMTTLAGKPLGMINAEDAHRISATLRFMGKDKPSGPLSRASIDRLMGKTKKESDFEMKCKIFGFNKIAARK